MRGLKARRESARRSRFCRKRASVKRANRSCPWTMTGTAAGAGTLVKVSLQHRSDSARLAGAPRVTPAVALILGLVLLRARGGSCPSCRSRWSTSGAGDHARVHGGRPSRTRECATGRSAEGRGDRGRRLRSLTISLHLRPSDGPSRPLSRYANSGRGLGWRGAYRPISPAPGILNCAIRPQPSSSIGDTNSTPCPRAPGRPARES